MFCVLSANTNIFFDEFTFLIPFITLFRKGSLTALRNEALSLSIIRVRSSSKPFMTLIAGARFFAGNPNLFYYYYYFLKFYIKYS